MFAAKSAWYMMPGWRQIAKLLASDAADNDNFGDVIAISADGNTIAVGAWLEDTSPFLTNGAAYIFTRSGTTWTQQAKLLASDAANNDAFGRSIAISSDGDTVAVGANQKDSLTGAAYIFTRSGTTWTEQAKLLASDAATGDQFGASIAISADGNTLAVGASGEDTSTLTNNGAAYIFTRSGTTWTQQAKLLASDRASQEQFGRSIAISADGNTLAVGQYNSATRNGAYIFTGSGTTWTQQAKLLASDYDSTDNFGSGISISGDGDTVAVGAELEDTSPNTNNGAAYIFTRSGTTWTQQAKLLASDRASSEQFGRSIAISADGTTLAVGAPFEDTLPNTNNGAAYVFYNQ